MVSSNRATLLAPCLTICTALAVLVAPAARADDAKDIFKKGVQLYNQNDYKGALAEFLDAYNAKPHHSVLYNIAQCYHMTDQGARALYYYASSAKSVGHRRLG